MFVLIIISQILMYLCFSFILGSFLLSLVPKTHRPNINFPQKGLIAGIAGIAIFSFFPVLEIILYLAPRIGVLEALQSILLTFEVGKAWVFTLIISIILLIFVCLFDYQQKAINSYIGILFILLLILSIGWTSHASSIDHVWGFISDTLHLTAVSVWVGILIVISWFSTNHVNWLNFLKWFTPVAIACFGSTIITGLILMNFVVPEYTNSWLVPYGQALLIKHLLIIPLLLYAVINSIFIKKRLHDSTDFNPRPWAKMESIIILLIFSATAVLGQESPPKESGVLPDNVSNLFDFIYNGQAQQEMTVQLALNPTSASFIALAILFAMLMVISFLKKAPAIMSFLMSVLLVVCAYFSLMLSIV
ncbi:CopD family protein [Lysinibacillus telephonicus]|uniref:copper resistance D family protein n=2 Tax=Lysinibacillus telephonicus TaxID=1714840 RepID=UPI0031FD24BF